MKDGSNVSVEVMFHCVKMFNKYIYLPDIYNTGKYRLSATTANFYIDSSLFKVYLFFQLLLDASGQENQLKTTKKKHLMAHTCISV